jgi:hypothetical protein
MKKYTLNQPLVLNNTRFDKGATIELTDKQATDMVSGGMISPVLETKKPLVKTTKETAE